MTYFANGQQIIDSASREMFLANVSILSTNGYLKVVEGFQGTVAGYTSGGSPVVNTIDKFPFATNANATDVGDLTQARDGVAGQSSTVSGYSSGGKLGPPAFTGQNTIDKFPFATNANATDVGDLTQARGEAAGQSSEVSGYTSGGSVTPAAPVFGSPDTQFNTIDKFPFATNANATDVGDLSLTRTHTVGQSSYVSGYSSGGAPNPPIASPFSRIDKFPFATNVNATNVGDLTVARRSAAGQSSDVSGYTSGGATIPVSNTIDKFPFASDGNATDVGDLTQARAPGAGQSSTVSGYTSGGVVFVPIITGQNTIDKFPFASDANATDVGDLTQARFYAAGQQD